MSERPFWTQKPGLHSSDVSAGSCRLRLNMAAETESCASRMSVEEESDLLKYGEDISPEKDGGVRKIVKVESTAGSKPPIGSKVKVFYRGTFLNSGEEFDSNFGRREPFEFEVGKGRLVFY